VSLNWSCQSDRVAREDGAERRIYVGLPTYAEEIRRTGSISGRWASGEVLRKTRLADRVAT